MLGFDIQNLIEHVNRGEYETALEKCEQFVSYCLTAFMEELTVDTATNFAAATHLYAQICKMLKKPWLAVPKLDSCRGALRFMKDYMTDTETLLDTYEFFAESYAYARFYPEAVEYYVQIIKFSDHKERCRNALKLCYFYEEIFGKGILSSEEISDKFTTDEQNELRLAAKEEAKTCILNDPIENTEQFLKIRFDIEAKVDKAMSGFDHSVPFCQRYWEEKQRILKEEFKISWHSPAQMNPNMKFY